MSRDFPGTAGNYLSVGDVAAVDIVGTAFSTAAWIRPTSLGLRSILAKHNNSNTAIQYDLIIDSSNKADILVGNGGGGFDQAPSAAALSTGVWSHVCGVKNGVGANALKMYVNGVQDASVTSNIVMGDTTQSLAIGRISDTNARLFVGLIEHCAIWNVALTAGEVAALGHGVLPIFIRPQNLKWYCPLFGTGSPEPDYTGNGNVATIVGTVPAGTGSAPVKTYAFPTLPGRFGTPTNTDLATVIITLTPSSADIQDIHEVGSIYLDLQPTAIEGVTHFDAATIRMGMTVLGGECFSTAIITPEGEASVRWSGRMGYRWDGDSNARFGATVTVEDVKC